MPITERQAHFLHDKGIDPSSLKGRGHAASVISRIKERQTLGLATPKQACWLRKLGHSHPELCSFQETGDFLTHAWRNRTALRYRP